MRWPSRGVTRSGTNSLHRPANTAAVPASAITPGRWVSASAAIASASASTAGRPIGVTVTLNGREDWRAKPTTLPALAHRSSTGRGRIRPGAGGAGSRPGCAPPAARQIVLGSVERRPWVVGYLHRDGGHVPIIAKPAPASVGIMSPKLGPVLSVVGPMPPPRRWRLRRHRRTCASARRRSPGAGRRQGWRARGDGR
jgi:hypothetical protein